MRAIFALLLALEACHPAPVPVPPEPAPACRASLVEVYPGVFTLDGHVCARCNGAAACVDPEIEIYCCDVGGCDHDPTCRVELEDQRK